MYIRGTLWVYIRLSHKSMYLLAHFTIFWLPSKRHLNTNSHTLTWYYHHYMYYLTLIKTCHNLLLSRRTILYCIEQIFKHLKSFNNTINITQYTGRVGGQFLYINSSSVTRHFPFDSIILVLNFIIFDRDS